MFRRDVEKSLRNMFERGYKQGYENALKENKGEWILKQRGKFVDIVCSKCGYVRVKDYAYNFTVEEIEKEFNEDYIKPNFCECCGVDMRAEPYKTESEE